MTSVFIPASINLRPEDGRTEAKRQEEIGMEKNVVIDKSSVLDHTMVSPEGKLIIGTQADERRSSLLCREDGGKPGTENSAGRLLISTSDTRSPFLCIDLPVHGCYSLSHAGSF